MTNSAGPEFVLSGRRDNTSMDRQGTSGLYWSSTADSATYAYDLGLNTSGAVYPASGNVKYFGFSLRCLAKGRKGNSFSTHTIYQLLTDSTGPNLVLSGYRVSTSMGGRGAVGPYWSSTAHSSAINAYNLDLRNSSEAVLPADYSRKYYAFSLRCLAE